MDKKRTILDGQLLGETPVPMVITQSEPSTTGGIDIIDVLYQKLDTWST